jgi:hypothetical protein
MTLVRLGDGGSGTQVPLRAVGQPCSWGITIAAVGAAKWLETHYVTLPRRRPSQPGRSTNFPSDEDDMRQLCGDRAVVVKLKRSYHAVRTASDDVPTGPINARFRRENPGSQLGADPLPEPLRGHPRP